MAAGGRAARPGHRIWRLLKKLVTWRPLLLDRSSSGMQSVTAGQGQQVIMAPGRALWLSEREAAARQLTFRTCLGSDSCPP